MYMTETQKKAIYDLLVKNFTVGTTAISASCVYENQIIPSGRDSEPLFTNATYPLITLKYRNTDEVVMDMDSVVMKTVMLDMNVFSYNVDERPSGDYVNGKIIVDTMAGDILTNLDTNYESLFSEGIFINERIKGTEVRDLSTISTRKHVYRNKFSIKITYEV